VNQRVPGASVLLSSLDHMLAQPVIVKPSRPGSFSPRARKTAECSPTNRSFPVSLNRLEFIVVKYQIIESQLISDLPVGLPLDSLIVIFSLFRF